MNQFVKIWLFNSPLVMQFFLSIVVSAKNRLMSCKCILERLHNTFEFVVFSSDDDDYYYLKNSRGHD